MKTSITFRLRSLEDNKCLFSVIIEKNDKSFKQCKSEALEKINTDYLVDYRKHVITHDYRDK
jgi:hypothetical protein